MSDVTNVLLCLPAKPDLDERVVLKNIDKWLRENKFGKLKNIALFAGGSHELEVTIYAGAYNHFPVYDFITVVTQQADTLDTSEDWQLLIKEQNDHILTERLRK